MRTIMTMAAATVLFATAGCCGSLSAKPAHNTSQTVIPVAPADREVGIAYTLWTDHHLWDSQTWGTPALGHYDGRDRSIIRKHAQWLTDAGVDFVWIDWSNNVTYDPDKLWTGGRQDMIEDGTAILFDEYHKMNQARMAHPRISIFIGVTGAPESVTDGRLQKKADQVWKMYANNPKYKNLIERYRGKPLLVVYTDTPSPWQTGLPEWNDRRFTVRWMTGFISEQHPLRTDDRVSHYGYWSWEDRSEQTYPICDGHPEAMVVCAATRKQGEPGEKDYIPAVGRRGGATLCEQFARAAKVGVHFAMVVSWNEWTTGEQPSVEVSKDLEPSVEWGDQYLKLLKEQIAKFKSE